MEDKVMLRLVSLVMWFLVMVAAAITAGVVLTNRNNNDRIKYYADHCKVVRETVSNAINNSATSISYACREEK